MATQVKHRCAVCWVEQQSHEAWFAHTTETHDAVLKPFDFDVCEHIKSCAKDCHEHIDMCPGIQHGRRLVTEGTVNQRTRPEPQPFTARDGTVYTPVPLPLDAA